MKIGVCLPYMKRELRRQHFLDWCRFVDQGPFHSLSCGERVTGYTLEMRNILAFAAAVTERVRIIPSLYVLPMHSAVQSAKEIATLDILSNGRVTLCVGVGGREQDYRALGASFKRRFQRMDYQVAEMKALWRGETLESLEEVGPLPLQEGGPPILAGSMGPKSIRRVAEWADGLYGFAMDGNPSLIRYFFDAAEQAWKDAGRDTRPYRMSGFWYCLAEGAEAQLRAYVYDYLEVLSKEEAGKIADGMVMHDPGAIREGISAIEELGCDEIQLVPATADMAELEKLATILETR